MTIVRMTSEASEAMGDSGDPYRLQRFVAAQDRGGTYQRALAELQAGLKVGTGSGLSSRRSRGWASAR